MRWKLYWEVIKVTGKEWIADNTPRLGAALAFYSVLSMGPLLLIVLSIAGLFFGHQAASGEIVTQIRGLVGDEGAKVIETILAHSQNHREGLIAVTIGIITLIFGATAVFSELQDALNTIWKVQAKPGRGILWIIRQRFLSFAVVLGTGFLLLVSLVLSAGLAALSKYFTPASPALLLNILHSLVAFGVVTALFAMIFKILPDAQIRWSDVWIGAAITAALFTVGKSLIGLYLGHSAISSAYGASGSLIVLLMWIYYSSQILFLGAEFTQVYSRFCGSRTTPARDAVPLPEKQPVIKA